MTERCEHFLVGSILKRRETAVFKISISFSELLTKALKDSYFVALKDSRIDGWILGLRSIFREKEIWNASFLIVARNWLMLVNE